MSIVNLQNVTYKYPLTDSPVLENINLQVEEGEFVAIIGPNGAGKSTLCYTLAGFVPHFYKGELTGSVEVAGIETQGSSLSEWVMNVGLAFQNPFNQISGAKYTVFEEIAFGLENIGVPRDEMKERVERALEMTGISDLAERSPYSLSGGQQQRVALTSILVMEPKVLVLDEPTSQMDPIGTREVFGVIRKMAERGMTVMLAEHKVEWIAQFADRVIALHEGKILLDGNPGEVLTSNLLDGKGFGISRYTSTAREAQKQGLWPKERNLPVTLDEAVEGFHPQPRPFSLEGRREQIMNIEIKDLHHTYPAGVKALNGITLTIETGEQVAIVGQNGAGKTTLVKHLNGLLQPTSGSVLIGDWDTSKQQVAKLASRVGYVFQNPDEQLFTKNVHLEVSFGPKNLGYETAKVEALVDDALTMTELTDQKETNPYDLSPTWRKMVALASIIAMDTPIIIFDEPTTGQDAANIARMADAIAALRERGKTVITITHDIDFCAENFERVIALAKGKVLLDGPANEVLGQEEILAQTYVNPPQLTRLGLRLGLPETVRNQEEFLNAYKKHIA